MGGSLGLGSMCLPHDRGQEQFFNKGMSGKTQADDKSR